MGNYHNLDRIFDQFFNDNGTGMYKTYKLISANQNQSIDDYEINIVKDGAYIHFEVPGFNKNNLDVLIEGSELVIEGSRKYKMNGEEKQKEINRRVELNNLYDPTTVEATVEDGLLTVYIPSFKKETQKRKNRINLM
ncbi:MAG: Hsp20/alpha crystallin family [Bacteroidota bacterium]|jgi:HSP20 family molecular chaperone IbpA